MAWSVRLVIVIHLLLISQAQELMAATLFSGSFVNLAVDSTVKDVSVNYPKPGRDKICGIEIKSNVIVLNTQVWVRLASKFEVREVHDDRFIGVAQPVIAAVYSPTLRYLFSRHDADFATFSIQSKNSQTLREIVDDVLDDQRDDTSLIAVAYFCDAPI